MYQTCLNENFMSKIEENTLTAQKNKEMMEKLAQKES